MLQIDERTNSRQYVEVESGKRNSRPQLQAAISHAKATGAKLVIARLDRLARNLHFVSSLQERGVDFVAADMPDANRLGPAATSGFGRYCCKSRKSNNAKNLTKVDL